MSRIAPPRPTVSIPLVDAELILGPATTALIASNAECHRAMNDPAFSSDKRADIATRHGQLAQAVLNLTTATREAHRNWRSDVDSWKSARRDAMHAAGMATEDRRLEAQEYRSELPPADHHDEAESSDAVTGVGDR